jgi:hypothetical protein
MPARNLLLVVGVAAMVLGMVIASLAAQSRRPGPRVASIPYAAPVHTEGSGAAPDDRPVGGVPQDGGMATAPKMSCATRGPTLGEEACTSRNSPDGTGARC